MSKMFGSMSAEAVLKEYERLRNEIKSDSQLADKMVMIPKGTYVALVGELKEQLNRKFFYELGKSFRLMESRESARRNVPDKYLPDFEDGTRESEALARAETQCSQCYKVRAINGIRGKIFIVKKTGNKAKNESNCG